MTTIWPLNEHKNLHIDNEYDIHIWDPETMRNLTTASIWIYRPPHNDCVFHILQEVG